MERTGASATLESLTTDWGSKESVALYLDRCQVDTPPDLVALVWHQVAQRRRSIGKVVDFGAGDGRFANGGPYEEYVGYEIDSGRSRDASLPSRARLLNSCAFQAEVGDADLCIGNPPYVRNQDLPQGWRQCAMRTLRDRTGTKISGLANAWQYFFLLALLSTRTDGLVALVIPFEWVSRPSAAGIREYIRDQGWDVDVFRLADDTFRQVLTTASITIVDKRQSGGSWRYFEQVDADVFEKLNSPSGSAGGVITYSRLSRSASIRAKRGVSPGTQRALVLTEKERIDAGLTIARDVVPCVTSLRHLSPSVRSLTERIFKREFRDANRKCWLIRTDSEPSTQLLTYLACVPPDEYSTSTCRSRDPWWRFTMPDVPNMLVSSGFRSGAPKVVVNTSGVRAVGAIYGVFGISETRAAKFAKEFAKANLSDRVVAHSNGLRKLEINQLNTLLQEISTRV